MFVDPRRGYDQPILRLFQSALSYVSVGFAAYAFILLKRSHSSVAHSVKHKLITTLCFGSLLAVWSVCTYVVYIEPLCRVYGRPLVISLIDLAFIVIWMYDSIVLSGKFGLCDLANELDINKDKLTKACHIQHASYAVGIALTVLYAWTWILHVFKGMIPIAREQGPMALLRPQLYLVGALSYDNHAVYPTHRSHGGRNSPYKPRQPIIMTEVPSD